MGLKLNPTAKEFLMTLAATTISIVLTFGTNSIVDRKKQNAAKREIVMMIMYDMQTSLDQIKECDEGLHNFVKLQTEMIANPQKYYENYTQLLVNVPVLNYITTTESIFKSNIETINTIGNVLFTETVAEFYSKRSLYNTAICDSISKNYIKTVSTFSNRNEVLSFSFYNYAILSGGLLTSMQQLFALSKQMMDISDEDLAVYSKEREKIEQTISEGDTIRNKMFNKVMQLNYQIEAAKAKTIDH